MLLGKIQNKRFGRHFGVKFYHFPIILSEKRKKLNIAQYLESQKIQYDL